MSKREEAKAFLDTVGDVGLMIPFIAMRKDAFALLWPRIGDPAPEEIPIVKVDITKEDLKSS